MPPKTSQSTPNMSSKYLRSIITSILLCEVTTFACFAQPQAYSVKWAVPAMIDDLSFPTIQLGFQFPIGKKVTWYNECGIQYRERLFEKLADTTFLPTKGIKLKSEMRVYMPKLLPFVSYAYIGGNVFLNVNQHNSQVSYRNKGAADYAKDAFGVNKHVIGGNLILGFEETIWKNLKLDVYSGLGVRFIRIHTTQKEYNKDTDELQLPVDFNISYMLSQKDANFTRVVTPNLTLGLRLCYTW